MGGVSLQQLHPRFARSSVIVLSAMSKKSFINDLDKLVKGSLSTSIHTDVAATDRQYSCSAQLLPKKRKTDGCRLSSQEKTWKPDCSLEELVADLSLPTFVLLAQACRFVPHCYLHRRQDIIMNIVRAHYQKCWDTEFNVSVYRSVY